MGLAFSLGVPSKMQTTYIIALSISIFPIAFKFLILCEETLHNWMQGVIQGYHACGVTESN